MGAGRERAARADQSVSLLGTPEEFSCPRLYHTALDLAIPLLHPIEKRIHQLLLLPQCTVRNHLCHVVDLGQQLVTAVSAGQHSQLRFRCLDLSQYRLFSAVVFGLAYLTLNPQLSQVVQPSPVSLQLAPDALPLGLPASADLRSTSATILAFSSSGIVKPSSRAKTWGSSTSARACPFSGQLPLRRRCRYHFRPSCHWPIIFLPQAPQFRKSDSR